MESVESKTRINVAITILSILIAAILVVVLLIPSIHRANITTKYAHAKTEMAGLVAAIVGYQTAYGRFPTSSNLPIADPVDFTFGTFETSDDALGITNSSSYQANNSEVMIALMDLDKFPGGSATFNSDHSRNPQRTPFLNARMANDTNSPGIGPDYVFRDPWGHPYIITIDLNGDKKCRDAFYRLASVSENASAMQSRVYLVRPGRPPYNSDEARDSFEVPGVTVIVWSFGPDGKADKTQKANEGVNKDNITSW